MRHINKASLLPLAGLLLAVNPCGSKTDSTGDTRDSVGSRDTYVMVEDLDGDVQSRADGDCDDNNPEIFVGQSETCNGLDDNCNGKIDEGFSDSDADGIADCVDEEECDGLDNDGDGLVDEDFSDSDGDGTADCLSEEICDGLDNDGNGLIDEGFDEDGDSYTTCGTDELSADCDDTDPDINPGADEVAGDVTDNDCDGFIDENDWTEGDIVITEIMNNPFIVSDTLGEWFEIYNTTDHVIYMNGIVLGSGVDLDYHQIQSDDLLPIAANTFMVLGIEDDYSLNGEVGVDYEYSDFFLSNESDEIYLAAEDLVFDEVTWDDGASMPDVPGASMNLEPSCYDFITNDDPDAWCAATMEWSVGLDMGSPGSGNELCTSWDYDGDGYSIDDDDCDDTNPVVYPGAPEIDPDLDNNCDGEIEVMPVADADYDPETSTLYTCDLLQLVGSGSYDGDGTELTYTWELESAPEGTLLTSADIDSSTDESPTITPDVAGTWIFTLTVEDEGEETATDTLILEITDRPSNAVPVADPGSDISSSANADCTPISYGETYDCPDCADLAVSLDGTGSYDADDDWLSYSWAVVSGSGSLDDSTSSTPTLTITGPSTEYGETSVESVEISLQVTDCMGETSELATMTVSYSCTGT